MGKEKFLLGIDIGSSQSKATLTDLHGTIIACTVVAHETVELAPGFYEHDPEQVWISDVKRLIHTLTRKIDPAQIAAIGLSAIGPCVLPIDEHGSPLYNAILYGIDTRAYREIDQLNRAFGEDFFIERCGNSLSTQAAGPKIVWLRENKPEVFQKATYFLTATSYLVYRLTGSVVMDYYTACAGYTPLFNYQDMCWDEAMCRYIGCEGRLPRLCWTAECAGKITPQAAAEFGLVAGTPVCAGTCDAAAEAVSVGVIHPGQTMLMLGSTAFMISVMDKPAMDQRLWAAPYLFPGSYCMLGGMGSAGSLTKWFLQELSVETQHEASVAGINPYALLAQKAANIPPGSDRLLALPYFCGERTPLNDPKARGVFFGLTLHHTQAHLYRALLESVGFGVRDNLEAMAQNGCETRDFFTAGGGAQNALWLQIISDITGSRQTINQVTLGASYGDAFLAGLSCGLIHDCGAIQQWTKEKTQIIPNQNNQRQYDALYLSFKTLYQVLYHLMQNF